MECPACRRALRFSQRMLQDGQTVILPSPYGHELNYHQYLWYDDNGRLAVFDL